MSVSTKHLYEFGVFRLDTRERLLLRNGARVKLERKVFETLVVLVQHSGRLVHKDEFMNQVWPDAVVEENNLEKSISVLRKVLGENGADAKYIETVRGLGYRFAADVQELDEEVSSLVRHESRTSLTIEEDDIDLNGNAPTSAALVSAPVSASFVSIRNSRSAIRIGAALAAVMITGAVLSYFFHFKPNRPPALTDQDTVLLADFDNRTGDPVFDGTLKEALAIQLEQSPFLNIFSDARVRETLRYMGRAPDERVTPEVAREICERQGLKAMFTGSIVSLGSHYVVLLEALNANTGDVIARDQGEAENKEQVLGTLGRTASKLREKLGESLKSIQRSDAPLERTTTSSLEALKAYALGRDEFFKGNTLVAISLFKRAAELDPNFAFAHAGLALSYGSTRQSELSAASLQRAYELRERVSDRERLYISSLYYIETGESDKYVETLELTNRTYPRDASSHNNLAVHFNNFGLFEKAVDEAREAVRLEPGRATFHSVLASVLIGLNRFDEAREVMERALGQKLESLSLHLNLYRVGFVLNDSALMKKQIDEAIGKPDEYVALDWQARSADFKGQARRAREFYSRAFGLAQQHDLKEIAAEFIVNEANRDAEFGDCKSAKDGIAKASAATHDRRTLIKASAALAFCGEAGQARAIKDELLKRFPRDTLLNTVWLPLIQAESEMQNGNAAQAIQLLESTRLYEGAADFQIPYVRGLAYLSQKKGGEADTEFQRILDHRGWAPLSPLYPLAQLGLARAGVISGDIAKARKAYEDFFALWKDADADIPILIEAKKEYAKMNSLS